MSVIEFNVSSRIYYIARSVIETSRPGLLSRMFTGPMQGEPLHDEQGRVFIGRDPDAFACVLAYLTTGIALVPAGVSRYVAAAELAYFFDELVAPVTHAMCDAMLLPELSIIVGACHEALSSYKGFLARHKHRRSPISTVSLWLESQMTLPVYGLQTVARGCVCEFEPTRLHSVSVQVRCRKDFLNTDVATRYSAMATSASALLSRERELWRDIPTLDFEDALASMTGATCVRHFGAIVHFAFDETSEFVRESEAIKWA